MITSPSFLSLALFNCLHFFKLSTVSTAHKFETLLQAIVSNRLISHKLPGNGHISASSEGFSQKKTLESLTDAEKQTSFNKKATQSSFLLGKFAFRKQDQVADMENFILDGIGQLLPLYRKLAN